MLDEKLVELKEIKRTDEIDKEIESEFQIVGDDDLAGGDAGEGLDSKKYYQFACKENTNKYLTMIFSWMLDTELEMREAAGMKFGIISAVIFGIIGALKVEYFYKISFMNYLFLQGLICLGILYYVCRNFDIFPFLENEGLNDRLKLGAACNFIGVVIYIASWNYWPRQYSHFLLCCIPLIENLREGLRTQTFRHMDFILLFINLVGFFILLAIPDRDVNFTYTGLILAVLGVALFWFAFEQLKKLRNENVVAIGMINTLVLSIFLPGFFGIVDAQPPSFMELVMIILLGIPTAVGLILMIRCVQITKPSHSLLAASVSLAIVSWVRSVNLEGLLIQGILGVIMSVGCAVIILYQQQDKMAIMSYRSKGSIAK